MDKDYSKETNSEICLNSSITYDGNAYGYDADKDQVVSVPEISTEIVVTDGGYTAIYIHFNKVTIRLMVDHANEDVGAFVDHWLEAVQNPTRTDRRDK